MVKLKLPSIGILVDKLCLEHLGILMKCFLLACSIMMTITHEYNT